jgi:uncharacterized damage-inducible protein DinB
MEVIDHLRRLFTYDAWANHETVASLERAAAAPQSAVRRMAHVVGAEVLWLARLEGRRPSLAVWPELAVEECEREANGLAAAWRRYFESLSEAALARRVAYVNSKGEPWESTAGDVLTHVALHSAYHRGQIASDLRAAGFEPAYTDFIHAVRQGFLERREES